MIDQETEREMMLLAADISKIRDPSLKEKYWKLRSEEDGDL